MHKHEHHDIWLHDECELSEIHGAAVVSREPLRSWPLSAVERVVFNDNSSRIYKAYHNIPTESEFYRLAKSRGIPEVYFNYSEGEDHWLLLEDVKGKIPENLNREQALALAGRAREIINAIDPVMCLQHDMSEAGYSGFARSSVELLRKLNREGKLKTVDTEAIDRFEGALSHPEALRAVRGKCTLLHGDLKCDNMIIRPDGELVIIDWQSVLYGPEYIDIYSLLAFQALDPIPIAGIGPEILRLALTIRWFATCLDRWMPWADFFDKLMSNIENHIRHIVEHNRYVGMEVYYFH